MQTLSDASISDKPRPRVPGAADERRGVWLRRELLLRAIHQVVAVDGCALTTETSQETERDVFGASSTKQLGVQSHELTLALVSAGTPEDPSPSVQKELIDVQEERRRRAVRVKPIHLDAR
jgi:hypothetical protein